MQVVINDRKYELAEKATVADALQLLRMAGDGLAVAVNYRVIPKQEWQAHSLAEGDVVMLVAATQGG